MSSSKNELVKISHAREENKKCQVRHLVRGIDFGSAQVLFLKLWEIP